MDKLQSSEDYLERILMLQNSIGQVRSIDIANSLEYSKPSVSIALKKLKASGHIHISESGYVTLTDKGYEIASLVLDKHNLLTEFLIALGVSKETAYKDACKLEHSLSYESYEKMRDFYNNTIKNK